MFVYRLASRLYAANTSEGARRFGGRWNRRGTPVIYTSAIRSLAALEIIVHYGAIPAEYHIVVIELPPSLTIESIELKDLPDGWPDEDSGREPANHGTEWARSLRTAVLCVPSAAIRTENNFILNPLHPDFQTIRFDVPKAEHIDKRLRDAK
jgi:RES domain-containing protein